LREKRKIAFGSREGGTPPASRDDLKKPKKFLGGVVATKLKNEPFNRREIYKNSGGGLKGRGAHCSFPMKNEKKAHNKSQLNKPQTQVMSKACKGPPRKKEKNGSKRAWERKCPKPGSPAD